MNMLKECDDCRTYAVCSYFKRCQRAPSEHAPSEPAGPSPVVGSGGWLGAAHKLSREIFELSQQLGVPECVRKHCDDARECLHHARVDMQFEAANAPTPSPAPCIYDTDRDGDCQYCHNRGGCKNMGGPYIHKSKYPSGTPDHASAGW